MTKFQFVALTALTATFASCGVQSENVDSSSLESVPGRKTIVVNRSSNTLTVYYSNGTQVPGFVGLPIITGKGYSTPGGTFYVEFKEKCPPWVSTRGLGSYAGCASGNPLGRRWIQFNTSSYGLHGNSNESLFSLPASQRYLSLGCVRLRNQDVERLYEIVKVGDKVQIN